jgi:hypothetical protein
MKITIIGLTIASLVIAPAITSLYANGEPTSSEVANWNASNVENFPGIVPNTAPDFSIDYDFRSFSPDISGMINDFVNTLDQVVQTGADLVESVQKFFNDPFNLGDNASVALEYLTKANRLVTNIVDAQTWYDSLSFYEENLYDTEIYPSIMILVKWLYYSPSELEA